MHKLEPILYVLVFMTLVMACEGVFLLVSGRRQANKQAGERLRRFANRLPSGGISDESRSIMLDHDARGGFAARIPYAARLQLWLYRAGMPLTLRSWLLLTVALTAAGFCFGSSILRDPLRAFVLSGLGVLPTVFVELRRRKRMSHFDRQLPDAMDLLCRSLRSGHSMRAGFQMAGEELPDPIGTEFALVAEEVSFGMDLRDALRNMGHRINHSDMPFFVNAVMIQRETGGNLAGILDGISKIVRQRLRFFAKVKSLLAQINMTANVLALMPLVMVLAVGAVNPEYTAPLFETPAGRSMLWIAAGLVAVGWLLCRRLGMVKY